MDLPTLRGIFTLLLMVAFVAIVIWAWSGKRRKDFDEAARLPLEENVPSPVADPTAETRESAGEKES